MACYSPLKAWYPKQAQWGEKQDKKMVFNPQYADDPNNPIELPCGQCIGCRIERSRQWAVRCMHEASLYENNIFITLTFNDESMYARDNPYTVDVRDTQLFLKKLRKKYKGITAVEKMVYDKKIGKYVNKITYPIRFLCSGEYGEKSGRPHYHLLLFNFDFPDKVMWKTHNGEKYYISEELSKLWPYGWAVIGQVTFQSAAYVSRYIMKKVNGEASHAHYHRYNQETDEAIQIKPEFITMSRRPGIAMDWYKKFKGDVYPKDFITVEGKKFKPPKFYDKILELEDPILLDEIKERRIEKAKARSHELTPERLKYKAKCMELKARKLVRNHDKDM